MSVNRHGQVRVPSSQAREKQFLGFPLDYTRTVYGEELWKAAPSTMTASFHFWETAGRYQWLRICCTLCLGLGHVAAVELGKACLRD